MAEIRLGKAASEFNVSTQTIIESLQKKGKELARLEKEQHKVDQRYEQDMEKVQTKRIKDDKEQKSLHKILWLLIREAE